MRGRATTESSPDAFKSPSKKEPQSKLQRSHAQDQGTDQLSRNKEAQDVTSRILALADERAYLLGMPKPSNETRNGIITGLDNISFLNETLARKDAGEEAEELASRKFHKKIKAENNRYEALVKISKALMEKNDVLRRKQNELLQITVDRMEGGARKGADVCVKMFLILLGIVLGVMLGVALRPERIADRSFA